MRTYDAIVVGGGLAGLTSAAYLRRYGLKTLLCEKRAKIGGLVETFWHQGFAFDAGIRAFENSGIVFPMLRDLGIALDFVKNDVSIGIAKHKIRLASADSLQAYIAMLEQIYPDEAEALARIQGEIRKVMTYMDVLYGIDNPLFMTKMDTLYLRKTLLPWFLKYQVNIRKASQLSEPIEGYMRRLSDNPSLIDMIIQHFFKQTPAFFALSYFSLYLDYCYPKGGTGQLAEKVKDHFEALGGELRTACAVTALDAKKHTITLQSGEVIGYKKLVWAADQKTLYNAAQGVDSPGFEKKKALSQTARGGDSVLTLFLGVDGDARYFEERSGAHMFYTPNTRGLSSLKKWEQVLAEGGDIFAWIAQYLECTTFEISCPVLRDPALAPQGQSGLIVSTLFDYGLVKSIAEQGAYERFKKYCTEKILDVLDKSLFEGIKDMTLFSLCATPITLERETHNLQGAITGWAFTNPVMPAENRFKQIAKAVHTPIPDVYQCGQWSFSPSGLPVSILTGKLAADQVRKQANK